MPARPFHNTGMLARQSGVALNRPIPRGGCYAGWLYGAHQHGQNGGTRSYPTWVRAKGAALTVDCSDREDSARPTPHGSLAVVLFLFHTHEPAQLVATAR